MLIKNWRQVKLLKEFYKNWKINRLINSILRKHFMIRRINEWIKEDQKKLEEMINDNKRVR